MLLYDNERAPNPRRVRIFLHEKGIDVPRASIDIMTSVHKMPDFAAKNPFMRVPVLELDDGTFLSESVAICRYFEEIQPDPPLFGRTAVEKATVEMWNRRVELGPFLNIAQGFRHTNSAMAALEVPQIMDWGIANQNKIDASLALCNEALARSAFVAGDVFTIADITLLTCVDFLRVLRRTIPDSMTNLRDWHERVSHRESAKA